MFYWNKTDVFWNENRELELENLVFLTARLTNLQSSVANSMAKNYAYWWSRFKVFCDQIDASVMPFSSETAGLFLSHLAETASGLGGVTNARAALNFYHSVKFPDSVSPAAGKNVGAIMKGINRRFQKPT